MYVGAPFPTDRAVKKLQLWFSGLCQRPRVGARVGAGMDSEWLMSCVVASFRATNLAVGLRGEEGEVERAGGRVGGCLRGCDITMQVKVVGFR